jgi:hypothetical protein
MCGHHFGRWISCDYPPAALFLNPTEKPGRSSSARGAFSLVAAFPQIGLHLLPEADIRLKRDLL